MGEVLEIKLQKFDSAQPWGFKMQGGADQHLPLHVAQCSPKSVSGQAGLKAGDGIIQICGENVSGWKHDQAKAAMVRAGNDVVLLVQRNAVAVKAPRPKPAAAAAAAPAVEPRSQLVEDSIDPGMNKGSKFRDVNPKTYQVMKEEEEGGSGARPASIFDRKKQDRSQYLKEDKKTIQKAFGQS